MDNKILIKLEKIQDNIAETIDAREWTFEDRSEKWQFSEKGDMFQEKTNELQEVFDNLLMTTDSLNTFLEI